MTGTMLRAFAVLVLLLTFAALPPPVGAAGDPGVSVAPQAGAPGTQFEVLSAGWPPNAAATVLIEPAPAFARSLEATTDAGGRLRLILDSTGFEEGQGYTVTVGPRGGGATVATTTFAVTSSQPERCFVAETGQCARGRFLAYWEARGGLMIHGYPLSPEFGEILEDGKPRVVQYFERTRLEYHPENSDPDFAVLVGQFGRRIRPADPPAEPDPMQVWFPQTGHNVPNDFYAYWTLNGGLAQFGLPLSEVFTQRLEDGKEYRVQYFERARFERHPENRPPYDILLGQFGRMILAQVQR
jgi:hypothetical protein